MCVFFLVRWFRNQSENGLFGENQMKSRVRVLVRCIYCNLYLLRFCRTIHSIYIYQQTELCNN